MPSSGRERARRQYEDEEDVIVWVNTVGPYNNRQETYSFYQLPYCRGQEVVEHHHETLGEVLQGMELINAGIGMQFKSAHPAAFPLRAHAGRSDDQRPLRTAMGASRFRGGLQRT